MDKTQLEQDIKALEDREAELLSVEPLDEAAVNQVRTELKQKNDELDALNAKEAQLEQTKEQKHSELQDLILGYDFNAIFNNTEANKIIHKLLFDQSTDYEKQLLDKNDQLSQLKQQLLDSDQKLNAAQTELEQSQAAHAEKDQHIDKLTADVQQASDLQQKLQDEQNKNAKLAAQLQEAQDKLAELQKAKAEFKPSEELSQLVEQAKKAQTTTLERANIGLARWGLPPIGQPEKEVSPRPTETSDTPSAVADTTVDEVPAEGEVNQFQEENGSDVAQGNANGEVAEQTVEARLAALEARVSKLEGVA